MQICLRNLRIAGSTDHVGNIPLRELNLNFKNRDDIKKSVYYPRSMYLSRPTQPYHFHVDLIWCDGTFKIKSAPKKSFSQKTFLILPSLWRRIKTADLPGELLLFSLRFLRLVLFEQLLCLYDAFPKIKNKNIFIFHLKREGFNANVKNYSNQGLRNLAFLNQN
jgi:hypothetical protein